MGASKDLFNKHRERIALDERITDNYPPFNHHKRFCEKVKENWLGDDKLVELLNSSDYMVITQAMIDYKMDSEYLTLLMAHADFLEPNHIKGSEYLEKFCKTPLENMERIYKKYTEGQQFTMQKIVKDYLYTEILKKKRLNK